ncbi:polar amino acid transport system ATP-binding protein [Actinokineospora baliensis]|uniref:amino acid ABC transporter ATP-binding protein n=1 Tax=Actinokineospora baliensis TaxID=547056 RepID=UPI001959C019|nr:amino acid ABC transporter ATP-binding protein [Actinokineospora baliensis]MBM7772983.1 polar amino acid transport system ATP-binding protein [Actinokineospora baliensis]
MTAAVTVRGAVKTYGPHRVLDEVDFTARAGEVTAIIGPSGSGKSTLLRAVNHLEPLDSGFVTVHDELIGVRIHRGRLRELSERAILRQRSRIGFVFQSLNLFPHLSVVENVIEAPVVTQGVPRREAIARAKELLAKVGLSDKFDAYPRQLSGGQQQRVAIARALALEPKLILFDEPTSALDPELVGEVLTVIRDLAAAGTTMVVVTHEIGFAREVADHVVFLDAGRVVEEGPPSAVLSAPRESRTREFLGKLV